MPYQPDRAACRARRYSVKPKETAHADGVNAVSTLQGANGLSQDHQRDRASGKNHARDLIRYRARFVYTRKLNGDVPTRMGSMADGAAAKAKAKPKSGFYVRPHGRIMPSN